MLTEKQIKEIREHLEKAQNPLFYYDNDADGLCSFLLFRRFLKRGKGVAIRSYPDLNVSYVHKAIELKSDYVFILDKPVVAKEFIEEVNKLGLPVVWIDHHDMGQEEIKGDNLYLYNVSKNTGKDKSYEPTSYLAYKITEKKEDSWVALMGCIADHYMPEFADEFAKEYPELWAKNVKEPFDVYYKTEIGKIALALNFGLKDSTTHIVQLQNHLIGCKTPNDVLAEVVENKSFRERYGEIAKKYNALIEEAKENVSGKMLLFEYGGDLSMSSEIANELSFLYPKKYIIVAFKKGGVCNLSLRGKNVRKILDKVLKELGDGSGGGHEDAVGGRIKLDNLPKFKELLEKEVD